MTLALGALALLGALLALAACSPLRTFNALVPKDAAGEVIRDVAYGADPRQTLDIYAPPGGAEGAPVLVFVHGGSWATGDKAGYSWAGRALASRGYLAVLPNYRLVPEGIYPAMVEDAALAIAWTHANAARFGGDPARLAVSGHSAGSYNAMMAAYAPEFLEAAGAPPGIVDAVVNIAGPTDFLPLDTQASRNAFGHLSGPALQATQPVNRVGPDAPPTLTIHGSADETVEPRHADALDAAMRAVNRPHRRVIYEGVDHRGTVLGLSRPFRGRVPTLDDMDAFLRLHLK